ncbi:pyridoxal phosphate-dependent aminotransferase [Wenzhouxiangella marina]|uniref:Aminotransferase n=1 Tax=Wenzhouxiangella marina TaxID=1579979 RepID=A0A0K0XXH3_9GAMM|nr:pyridoxal phosphate-dependent aminotransferase [Wenzhouxiangella marina]AKS42332.1 Aspartate aminotransferase [Wenzhouxiangella marina]MBB6085895.1 aspartate aminotransferase [Wenzhouxiangella marina]
MSIRFSSRVAQVKPSATIAMSMKAAELRAQGRDILSLSMGEPDFDTPEHVREAAIRAIREGQTRYTAVDGTPALKQAVIAKLARDNGLEYQASEILVSCGAKQSIYNLLQALLDEGDEVLIPAPYWVSYPDMVRLAGAAPVILNTTDKTDYRITPAQLASAITEQTRLLIFNSPSNPTGRAYSRKQLSELAEVLLEHPRLMICSDDIYEHIWWADSPFTSLGQVAPALKDRLVVINGVSKAYAMTGWRIGYAAGPAELIREMRKIQGQSTSNPCSIAQAAATAALNGDQACVSEMCQEFKRRHDWLVPSLDRLPGVRCTPGQGSFYAFADFQEAIETLGLDDDLALAEMLLEKAGVATVPGTAFGAPGHLRLSFACDLDTLKDAVRRIGSALQG